MDLLRTAEAPASDNGEWLVQPPASTIGPRRVVHVITRLLLGGSEENTLATCLHQASEGQQVTVLHGAFPDPSWERRFSDRVRFMPVDSLVHPLRPLADLRAVADLARMFRRIGADVVHTHGSKAGIVGRVAAAVARVPLVVHTIHIAPFLAVSPSRRRFYVAAEWLCGQLTDLLIAVSRGMQQAYLDAGIGYSVPIPIIHSGMPLERFVLAAAPADWAERIGGWHRTARPQFVLKLASFEERKRQQPLIRSLAAGLRQRPDVCLLLAGEGIERQRCEEETRSLGLTQQIRFLGHDPAPWELVALADVCVHAADREGLPRSAVQAIAGGKPLLVARLPGIDELVDDGVNGVVADPDDLTDLADRLFALLDKPADLARLQAGARNTDVSSWREELMGENVERAYSHARDLRERAPQPIQAIEFFGLPGAGKTTVANELLSLLREGRGDVAYSRNRMGDDLGLAGRTFRRLALVGRASLSRPTVLASSSLGLKLRGGLRNRCKTLWNLISVLALERTASRGELLISDQGLAQAVWGARIQNGATVSVAKLFDLTSRGLDRTLFVYLETSGETARDRLSRRRDRTSRFQEDGRINDAPLWDRATHALEQVSAELTEELRRRGHTGRLLRFTGDAHETPRQCARRIYEHLRVQQRVVRP